MRTGHAGSGVQPLLVHEQPLRGPDVLLEMRLPHVQRFVLVVVIVVVAAAVVVIVVAAARGHFQVEGFLLRHHHGVRGGRDAVALVLFAWWTERKQ